MKITAVIVTRNDNYGGNLNERATYCINSMINSFDEVILVDWNSDTNALLYDIQNNIEFKGNLKHIVITPEIANILVGGDPDAQKCCEALARNIGIRRATGDYIISTNIDIIAPLRNNWLGFLDKETFCTISRREVEKEWFADFYNTNQGNHKWIWRDLREQLIKTSQPRHFEEKTTNGDDYSIINCCGDFQVAHRDIWNEIRGFEEDLIYSLYTDTNVQKKAVMHGFGLKAIYEPALFHINHGRGGGGYLDGVNKRVNDVNRAIINQNKTQNGDDWGFNNIEIEYELL
jgi:hypothetical protein